MARTKSDGGVSKMKMVREALQELGSDAKPNVISDLIQNKYKTEIPNQIISSYKSTINKKAAGGETSGGTGRVGRPPKAAAAPVGNNLTAEDVQKLGDMLKRIGIVKLKALVDLLG